MRKIFLTLMVTATLFSCNQPPQETNATKAPIDSFIANWSTAWSNHDSTRVVDFFADDALLTDDNLLVNNKEAIAKKWIHPNINVVNNFKASKLQEWSTNERAGYTGTYEFDVKINDSIVAKPKGIFTFNWIKGSNDNWKITTATIHSFNEKK